LKYVYLPIQLATRPLLTASTESLEIGRPLLIKRSVTRDEKRAIND